MRHLTALVFPGFLAARMSVSFATGALTLMACSTSRSALDRLYRSASRRFQQLRAH